MGLESLISFGTLLKSSDINYLFNDARSARTSWPAQGHALWVPYGIHKSSHGSEGRC